MNARARTAHPHAEFEVHALALRRPLEAMYPVSLADALRVTSAEDAVVRDKAVYRALGVPPGGTRDILCPWLEQTEGLLATA